MIDLYLDCDGVILNTIDKTKEWMVKDRIDPFCKAAVDEYFATKVDWERLIYEAGVLDDALNKIMYLESLGIYKPTILTAVSSELEPFHKIKYFNGVLPNIEIITVPYGIRKDSVVDAKNSILVDDSKTNILNWRESGGIGLHFVKGNPNLDLMEIDDLMDITKFNDKCLIKRLTRK